MRRLEGKVAIVTGAGSGIGEAVARRFVAEGARVAIGDVDASSGKRVAASLGESAIAIATDVADPNQVEQLIAGAAERWGGLDVLVNNAGVAVFGDPLAISEADWRRCMAVDLEGAWSGCRAALPRLLARGGGAIVNIISNHSFQVMRDTFPYPVAKHALLGLTRALALQYADKGIAVNAISPGWIETPLTLKQFAATSDPQRARAEVEAKQPIKRLGRPEEIAAIAVLLASDEARFIIGANINADGGVGIRMYE
jgi:NAD(P)-dependent dehydrogenase (short-subunit alcohol dehydrogenase family)